MRRRVDCCSAGRCRGTSCSSARWAPSRRCASCCKSRRGGTGRDCLRSSSGGGGGGPDSLSGLNLSKQAASAPGSRGGAVWSTAAAPAPRGGRDWGGAPEEEESLRDGCVVEASRRSRGLGGEGIGSEAAASGQAGGRGGRPVGGDLRGWTSCACCCCVGCCS